MSNSASTGLDGLDQILCDLKKGDNVVWQVDSVEDYLQFVRPYVEKALADGKRLVYMRFANHEPLITNQSDVAIYNLDATSGFEAFSTQVHSIISHEGYDAYYVFDCLSDLLGAWATDMMIGNFFRVTCPYLYELDTIAYFAILRNYHSYQTIARIRGTTQLLLDLYHYEDNFYVHPLKVWNRYSPTMFLPHIKDGEKFTPIINSIDASKLFSHISEKGLSNTERGLDYWDKLFMNARDLLDKPKDSPEVEEIISQLCRIMVGREKRISDLVKEYFTLEDLINIKSRLVGTGFIGGKATGMLLAQNILLRDEGFDWADRMEPHDSFYIGSDVFYSYIVENGWWKRLMEQKTREGYFDVATEMKEKLLKGKFPSQIRERFQEVIEYFGQSPIIVRSSSLLEDSFGNAFAGKYESIFLVNQGDPDDRYHQFEEAVRRIYASTMGEDALTYRRQRGLDEHDEQMALLVQRVSGSYHNDYFFPDMAGVGVSYNTFVWKPHLDPKAGMLRLVFGLGTRAVDRVEDDYPQIIALDHPLLRPYSEKESVKRFSQHNLDLLDIRENSIKVADIQSVLNEESINVELDLITTPDRETVKQMRKLGMKDKNAWLITFEKLLSQTDFTDTMQRMLKTIEKHYEYPVDIEYTANFSNDGSLKINLVQCRPLQTKGLKANITIPDDIDKTKLLFESFGFTMGGNISQGLKRIICVEPKGYTEASLSQKYDIARLVGKLNKQITSRELTPTMLLGPGRWGTTTPSLGVPVSFSEINNITVMSEVAYEGGNLMPELSFGTHFFQDLVESDIFYVALFPQKENVIYNKQLLSQMPNILTELVPEGEKYADVVKVYDTTDKNLQIMCDVLTQRIICFFNE